ncbi:MAG: HAD-IIB family hydrolase [Desulfobacteraceae bacterium]|nr:HAD-IIB family hydrolase [Desulfobacteraceae bacterium]
MTQNGLYIHMFSLHGLVRAENLELGRDADTGGQIKYVIELGQALSEMEAIGRVDLFTRIISDKSISEDYARAIEPVNDKFRIVRIQCGGRKYIRKEKLWPHLDEFVDKTIKFIKRENALPDMVHGHYPDAGYVAKEISRVFGMPFIYTGHSLGRAKQEKLLNEGLKPEEIEKKYRINQRIETEEDILKYADLIFASTSQEVKEQYGLYRNHRLPQYHVAPPGIDIEKFYPFYHDMLPETERTEESMYAQASVIKELNRFFMYPEKPLILALCRPDKRKNIDGLIKAYGEDPDLQALANLAVFAGIRKDISRKEENERDVLTRMLLLLDKYDLYGKMAIPKKHDFEHEVPELYRIAADKKGVFVNPALTEPFGLTLLEASATGLPVVATNDGGPKDIINNCKSGKLVDVNDLKAMARAIKDILVHEETWDAYSKQGILNTRKYYTWESHAKTYIKKAFHIQKQSGNTHLEVAVPKDNIGRRLTQLNYMLITDIDNTLLGGPQKDVDALVKLLAEHKDRFGFGIATGRTLESAVAVLKANNIPSPDVIISSVGSEIHYGPNLAHGRGWETHIGHRWDRKKITAILESVDFLQYQAAEGQRKYKASYNMTPGKDRLPMLHRLLSQKRCQYNLIYSHEKYLDILPYRASKGKAIRYLSYKWEIPLKNFLICGDSGNDEEMLRGEPAGVVVGNYSPELEGLRKVRKVYFAGSRYAAGIIEGIRKYRFFNKVRGNDHHGNSK